MIGKVLGKGRAANFFHEVTCHFTGHPVDAASGRMLTSDVELRLPGPIPLVWKRQYATSWSERNGPLGWGWSHSYDMAVWGETGKMVYQAEDGREIEFDLEPEARDRMPWLKPNERLDRFNHLVLRELRNGTWELESLDGLVRVFAPIAGDRIRPGRARLVSIRDRFDHSITFGYDPIGNLATIVDSAGRTIRVESDQAGRVARVLVPAPEAEAFVEYLRYDYSPEGDLVAATDVLGRAMRMGYERHLMVKETKRGGLSFHFAYEGRGNDARCIATWGDGGIYKRKLIYDTNNHTTIVTDSRDATTIYQMNADNAVVSVTDALGAVTKYDFDDCYNKIAETDPLDHTTKWTKYDYDPEGNLAKKTPPDGSEWKYEWNGAGMLAKVVRPDAKTIEFGYDALGRRVWKKYGAKTTKWIWDGNVPVHEWVEVDPAIEAPPSQQEAVEWESGLTARKFMLTKRFAQGPPPPEAAGTANAPITWVFEPESFAPLAKLTATARFGIVTDHLGTPTAMLDERGKAVWSADIGVYGDLRNVVGEKAACPFRWPGQYEDEETGLYYNRFRYYDPGAGNYISQDPIGLKGGLRLHRHVNDPNKRFDAFGLDGCTKAPSEEPIPEPTRGRSCTVCTAGIQWPVVRRGHQSILPVFRTTVKLPAFPPVAAAASTTQADSLLREHLLILRR